MNRTLFLAAWFALLAVQASATAHDSGSDSVLITRFLAEPIDNSVLDDQAPAVNPQCSSNSIVPIEPLTGSDAITAPIPTATGFVSFDQLTTFNLGFGPTDSGSFLNPTGSGQLNFNNTGFVWARRPKYAYRARADTTTNPCNGLGPIQTQAPVSGGAGSFSPSQPSTNSPSSSPVSSDALNFPPSQQSTDSADLSTVTGNALSFGSSQYSPSSSYPPGQVPSSSPTTPPNQDSTASSGSGSSDGQSSVPNPTAIPTQSCLQSFVIKKTDFTPGFLWVSRTVVSQPATSLSTSAISVSTSLASTTSNPPCTSGIDMSLNQVIAVAKEARHRHHHHSHSHSLYAWNNGTGASTSMSASTSTVHWGNGQWSRPSMTSPPRRLYMRSP